MSDTTTAAALAAETEALYAAYEATAARTAAEATA